MERLGSTGEAEWVEKRGYPRVPTAIPATILVFTEEEAIDCLVTDLSASGAGIQYDRASPSTERVCRLDISWFGTFEGITIRDGGNSFGVRFLIGEAERLHLLGKLTKFVEVGLSPTTDDDTIEMLHPKLLFKTTRGDHHFCEVLNITLRGVYLKSQVRPPLGELVRVGNMYGRINSHHEEGLGVAFVSLVRSPDRSGAQALAL
jgi:hypothetical protein